MPSRRSLTSLTTTLGYALVFLGAAKLNGLEWAVQFLNKLNVPSWAVPLVGWGEVIIGITLALVAVRRWTSR